MRAETDTVTDRIGFRTIATDGSTILLNGEPIFLAGISLHDEAIAAEAHRIRTPEEAREILGHAKDLGCVFVRLAHYQHNEHTVRACDELGLLAWCELPVYWGINWDTRPRFGFQALLPFLLAAALAWRHRPRRWPLVMLLSSWA